MKPNTKIEVMTGALPETVKVSSQYRANKVTIVGLDEGVLTIRARTEGDPGFEDVMNGTLQLDSQHTITIRNTQIAEFEFAVTPSAAYTVKIKQTDADTER